jgi:hypothetical protein
VNNKNLLKKWINPIYLDENYIEDLKETVKSKPEIKYLVLDNFFNIDKLERFIEEHEKLVFDDFLDQYSEDGKHHLPYDSALQWMNRGNCGYDFLTSNEWFNYLLNLFSLQIRNKCWPEIKLRKHRAHANGFWVHSDSNVRDLVFISYFNKNWKVEDGGILQLWRIDECRSQNTTIAQPELDRKMTCLNNIRINAKPGGWPYIENGYDLILVDQILPIYNRVFICNLKANPTLHSVTPSNTKERLGFVQWLHNEGDFVV